MHSESEGEIHYNLYVPESYDGSEPYALFFTLPGYEGLYFQGVGVNLYSEDFGFTAREYIPDMIIAAPQFEDWGETSADQTIALAKYIIQYCKESVERAKKAMEEKDNIIRVGISPMTPAAPLLQEWTKVQKDYPDIKLQMIPFMNSQESAREILRNLGTNIDVVAGIFDETMLKLRQCAGMEMFRQRICCAVSATHRLADKEVLTFQDLHGENFLMMHRGWSNYVDELREDIWKNHPQIHVIDFDIYSMEIFNRCENSDDILMAVENWKDAHPLLKIIPVEWKYTIPYGILYSPEPSDLVKRFLKGVKKALSQPDAADRV